MFSLYPYTRKVVRRNNNHNVLNELFDDFFTDNKSFKVDLSENEKGYLIEALLPGFKKDDIKIDYKEGKLAITVEKELVEETDEINYLHKEIEFQNMKRVIYLKDIVAKDIKAKLEEGILKVVVPKDEAKINAYKVEIE